MDAEAIRREKAMLKLRDELLAIEKEREAGAKDCSLQELSDYLENIIKEVEKGNDPEI